MTVYNSRRRPPPAPPTSLPVSANDSRHCRESRRSRLAPGGERGGTQPAAAGNRSPGAASAAKRGLRCVAAAGNRRQPAARPTQRRYSAPETLCSILSPESRPGGPPVLGQPQLPQLLPQCTRSQPRPAQKMFWGRRSSRCTTTSSYVPRRCRESNPDLPRDRRRYSPLYYSDLLGTWASPGVVIGGGRARGGADRAILSIPQGRQPCL